jgi:2-dehydro-3-deoxygluconokinase
MSKRLLAIGECMVEMASISEGIYRQGFAGDTFNMIWHARRALGEEWHVGYFTAVGHDAISNRMLEFMQSQHIDVSLIRRIERRTPGLYIIDLKEGERQFTYWRDHSAAHSLADDEETLEKAISSSDAIYFSGITLAILSPDARNRFLSALERARLRGALIAFDSNIRKQLWGSTGEMCAAIRAASKVSTIGLPTVPDELEAFQEANAEAVAERYHKDGVAEVVVKAGAESALVSWSGRSVLIAPEKRVKPVDTTGAGDSFNGTYVAARLSGNEPETAVAKAHATAGRVIQAYGALA